MFHNALVIVMVDHGHRFAKLRDAQQGRLTVSYSAIPSSSSQLDERLPFFAVYLPETFREAGNGSKAFANLKKNANRLTSFDIYTTLADVIRLPTAEELSTPQNAAKDRSLSLFREIPESRTCSQVRLSLTYIARLKIPVCGFRQALLRTGAHASIGNQE